MIEILNLIYVVMLFTAITATCIAVGLGILHGIEHLVRFAGRFIGVSMSERVTQRTIMLVLFTLSIIIVILLYFKIIPDSLV